MKSWQHSIIILALFFGFPFLLWHALQKIVLWIWGAQQLTEWGMGIAWIAWAPGFIVSATVLFTLDERLERLARLEEDEEMQRRNHS